MFFQVSKEMLEQYLKTVLKPLLSHFSEFFHYYVISHFVVHKHSSWHSSVKNKPNIVGWIYIFTRIIYEFYIKKKYCFLSVWNKMYIITSQQLYHIHIHNLVLNFSYLPYNMKRPAVKIKTRNKGMFSVIH
jgi:hypothetical protein